MNDFVKNNPVIVAALSAMLGGGLGTGGTTYFTKTDAATIKADVASLKEQVKKQWEVKADKEYIDLKIQALCK